LGDRRLAATHLIFSWLGKLSLDIHEPAKGRVRKGVYRRDIWLHVENGSPIDEVSISHEYV
jgi:hypothetical protein